MASETRGGFLKLVFIVLAIVILYIVGANTQLIIRNIINWLFPALDLWMVMPDHILKGPNQHGHRHYHHSVIIWLSSSPLLDGTQSGKSSPRSYSVSLSSCSHCSPVPSLDRQYWDRSGEKFEYYQLLVNCKACKPELPDYEWLALF